MIVDNEFKGLIPPLSKEEYTGLEQSIITEGCRESIITWNDIVIDGHNRYEICTKNNIPYKTLPKVFNSRHEVINWIIENQLGRRNLTPEQKLYLIGKKYKEEKKQVGAQEGNKNAQKQREQNVPFEDTADRIADQYKVSHMTVKRAEKFAEAVDKIAETAGQEVKQKILSREIDLTQKEVVALAQIGPEKQEKALEIIEQTKESFSKAYKDIRIAEKREEHKEKLTMREIPKGEYEIILADPPWKYEFSETRTREVENQYPTMELEEIKNIKIPKAKDSVLFLWATAPKLIEAIEVMQSWGYKYKTNAVWNKGKIGMGYWFRGQHELLLVGVSGNFPPPVPESRISSVLNFQRQEHSKKPIEVYEIIERMFPMRSYCEIFSRNSRTGWASWGNENHA